MNEDPIDIEPEAATNAKPASERSLWMRLLLMIVMGVAYYVSGILLFVVAVTQFFFALLSGKPSPHLLAFSRSLGLYYQQNVQFLTFLSEEVPFPFNPWP